MTITRQQLVDKLDSIAQDANMAAQLNMTLTELRDAIIDTGGDATTTKDLLDKLEAVRALLAGTLTVSGTVGVNNHPSEIEVNNLPADYFKEGEEVEVNNFPGDYFKDGDSVEIASNAMVLWGADDSTRPGADTVDVGTAFIAIDGGAFNAVVSDGTDWQVV